MPKLIQGIGWKLRLAAAALAVLGIGVLLAPRAARKAPPSEEKVAPILQQQVERREPARVFRGVQDAGRKALPFSVAFPAPPRIPIQAIADFERPQAEAQLPAGFGILVSDRMVLTHVAALSGDSNPALQLFDGTRASARLLSHEPGTGLTLLRLESGAPLPAPVLAKEPPAPGELVVAAAYADGRAFVAPAFIASIAEDRYSITAASGLLTPGTPLYNLAGEALAVIAGRPWVSVAFSAESAVARLLRRADSGRGLPRTIGAVLQPMTPGLARLLGAGGALVSDLDEAGPARRGGLLPGDVVLRIAGREVRSLDDALDGIGACPSGRPPNWPCSASVASASSRSSPRPSSYPRRSRRRCPHRRTPRAPERCSRWRRWSRATYRRTPGSCP